MTQQNRSKAKIKLELTNTYKRKQRSLVGEIQIDNTYV